MNFRLTKFLPGARANSTSRARALASSAGDSNLPDPVVEEGHYVQNNGQQHQALIFNKSQSGRPIKVVEADVMRNTAKALIYNRILDGHFLKKVSAEEVENLAAGMLEEVNAEDSLTMEEKKDAAEMGVRQAFQMFNFIPKV